MKEFATFYRPLLATDDVIDPSAPLRGQAHLLSAYKPFVRTVALGRVSADSACSKAMGTCGVRPGNVMELLDTPRNEFLGFFVRRGLP